MGIRSIKAQQKLLGNTQSKGRIFISNAAANTLYTVTKPTSYISAGIKNKLNNGRIKFQSHANTFNAITKPVKEFKNNDNKKQFIKNSITNTKNNIKLKKDNIISSTKDFIEENSPQNLINKTKNNIRNSQLVRKVYDRPKNIISNVNNKLDEFGNRINTLSTDKDKIKSAIQNSKKLKDINLKELGLNSKLGQKAASIQTGAINLRNNTKDSIENLKNTTKGLKTNATNNINKLSTSLKKDGAIATSKKIKNKATHGGKALKQAASKKAAEISTKAVEKFSKLTGKIKIAVVIIGIITIGLNIAGFVYGASTLVSGTPHYYCDLKASKQEKQSEMYKRYCTKGYSGDRDENGIPIAPMISQGSGVWNQDTQSWDHTDWPNQDFWDNKIYDHGCNVTSAAVALSYITGEVLNPAEIGLKTLPSNDFLHYLTPVKENNIEYEFNITWAEAVDALDAGDMVVALMSNSTCPGLSHYTDSAIGDRWTEGGHFILLLGITDDGRIAVNDPGYGTRGSYWYMEKKTLIPQELFVPAFLGHGSSIIHIPDGM